MRSFKPIYHPSTFSSSDRLCWTWGSASHMHFLERVWPFPACELLLPRIPFLSFSTWQIVTYLSRIGSNTIQSAFSPSWESASLYSAYRSLSQHLQCMVALHLSYLLARADRGQVWFILILPAQCVSARRQQWLSFLCRLSWNIISIQWNSPFLIEQLSGFWQMYTVEYHRHNHDRILPSLQNFPPALL